jgi:hypothetical protein
MVPRPVVAPGFQQGVVIRLAVDLTRAPRRGGSSSGRRHADRRGGHAERIATEQDQAGDDEPDKAGGNG